MGNLFWGNAVSKALNGEEGRGVAARSVDECAITEAGPARRNYRRRHLPDVNTQQRRFIPGFAKNL